MVTRLKARLLRFLLFCLVCINGIAWSADNEGNQLVEAVRTGDLKSIDALLDKGADVNAVDDEGNSLIAIAAIYQHDQVVLDLLKRGAELYAIDPSGDTAVNLIVLHCQIDTIKTLIDFGADLSARDKSGNTPFFNAITNRKYEVVDLLLTSGSDPNQPGADGMTPLMQATFVGDADMVDHLLDYGALVDAEDDLGHTALTYARTSRKASILAILRKWDARDKAAEARAELAEQ
jgi:ankyrin repeat protein